MRSRLVAGGAVGSPVGPGGNEAGGGAPVGRLRFGMPHSELCFSVCVRSTRRPCRRRWMRPSSRCPSKTGVATAGRPGRVFRTRSPARGVSERGANSRGNERRWHRPDRSALSGGWGRPHGRWRCRVDPVSGWSLRGALCARARGWRHAFDPSAILVVPPGSLGQRLISGHGSLCLGDRPDEIDFSCPEVGDRLLDRGHGIGGPTG